MEQQSSDLDSLKNGVEHLLKFNQYFVLFRHPNESLLQCFVADNEGGETFTFQAFDGEGIKLQGSVLSPGDWSTYTLPELPIHPSTYDSLGSWYMEQNDYENYVEFIRKSIARGEITKCVAARLIRVDKGNSFSALETYLRMSLKYPRAYCYLANTPVGLWMGATPELLLKTRGNKAYTMALAGTKLNTDISPWTNKEYEEQAIVSEYILNKLGHENIKHLEQGEVYEAKAGHLKHLRTDIQFEASPKALKALHPTPAVCGIPVSTAKEIIKKFERDQRALYAGYLGLDGQDSSYYVNLRCMRIAQNHIDLFVGAGITQDSDPHAEWLETAAKAETMKNILS